MRKCVYHKQLDLDTLVATRGPNFSLSRLESRVWELWKLKGACSLSRRAMLRKWGVGDDLPLNFHPATIRASAGFAPWGAGGATCDRRSWSGLRSRSRVAERLAA
jgi:hypothetical protein